MERSFSTEVVRKGSLEEMGVEPGVEGLREFRQTAKKGPDKERTSMQHICMCKSNSKGEIVRNI